MLFQLLHLQKLQAAFKTYLEDIFGLKAMTANNNGALSGVMDLLIRDT